MATVPELTDRQKIVGAAKALGWDTIDVTGRDVEIAQSSPDGTRSIQIFFEPDTVTFTTAIFRRAGQLVRIKSASDLMGWLY